MKKVKLVALCVLVMLLTVVDFYSTQIDANSNSNKTTATVTNNSDFTYADDNGNIIPTDTTSVEDSADTGSLKAYGATDVTQGVLKLRTQANSSIVTSYTDIYGRSGYINGYSAGDAAFLGEENGKYKFMISGVIGYMDASANNGQPLSYTSSLSVSYYYSDGTYLYHWISNDAAANGSGLYSQRIGYAPSYLSTGTHYYSYDGHYFYTSYVTMLVDYINTSSPTGTRANSVNPANPYYNYFQYLSARSKTIIADSTLNNYIASKTSSGVLLNSGSSFISCQKKYGVNALLALAHAALESSWGNSSMATTKNNLFGISAYDSNTSSAKTYASASDCITDYMKGWLSINYLDPLDYRYSGAAYGDKNGGITMKWASDPYGGEKIASLATTIDLNCGSLDYNRYQLGIKTTNSKANVYSLESTSAPVLYKTAADNSYPVIIQSAGSSFYRIQADEQINATRTGLIQDIGSFVFGYSFAYIQASEITKVNTGNMTCQLSSGTQPTTTGISYTANVEDYCWQNWVSNGATAGTTGVSKRIEGIKIGLSGYNSSATVSYRTHVSNVGWGSWVSNTAVSNELGTDEQIEAIQIKLANLSGYNVQYRVHVQNIGWMDWVENGAVAGTTGRSLRVEAIQIKLVPTTNISYQTHIQNIGWQSPVSGESIAGTTGQSLRMEAFKLSLTDQAYSGDVTYSAHVQNIGWQNWVSDGALAGTSGQSLRMEALKIKLTGEIANHYSIQYRAHVQNVGWQSWVSDGEVAGTSGKSLRIEAIQIKLVAK